MNIGLLGFGVVGGGVWELAQENRALNVKKVLVRREAPSLGKAAVQDVEAILRDTEIDTVVEVLGGLHPAYEWICRALAAGKDVVTANKAVISAYYRELTALARENGVALRCTAAVGGGIPWLTNLEKAARANHISRVWGILNGTTNYILTQMIHNGVTFADALKQAQLNGYAEKDPTADIEGHDACRKICILSDLAYGDKFDPDQVSCEGITKITLEDVANADKLGCVIKLLGRSVRCEDGTAYAYVAPHLIHKESPLAAVEDVFNAIMIDGNATGEVMFYGKGAGKLATASAVVADMLDSIEHKDNRRRIFWGDGSKNLLRPLDTLQSAWYVRFKGAQKDVEELLPVESLTEPAEGVFVVQTRKLSTAEMNAAAEKLNGRGEVRAAMRIL